MSSEQRCVAWFLLYYFCLFLNEQASVTGYTADTQLGGLDSRMLFIHMIWSSLLRSVSAAHGVNRDPDFSPSFCRHWHLLDDKLVLQSLGISVTLTGIYLTVTCVCLKGRIEKTQERRLLVPGQKCWEPYSPAAWVQVTFLCSLCTALHSRHVCTTLGLKWYF